MSHRLVDLSPDLKKIRDEGYSISINSGYLFINDIPYVNSIGIAKRDGVLVSKLELLGDVTAKPTDHTVRFIGEHPCDKNGNILAGIQHSSSDEEIIPGIIVNHSFSNKPTNGYENYHHKMSTYVNIISPHATAISPKLTPRKFKILPAEEGESVFRYIDTNSSRADIVTISKKIAGQKVAIIGLGGTGSYILDLVAKTEVAEIHLYDNDIFRQHNAFRSPGAFTKEELETKHAKVRRHFITYNKLHRGIIEHVKDFTPEDVDKANLFDFVFICIDVGEDKKTIEEKLITLDVPFIDTGVGIMSKEGSLLGSVRTSFVDPKNTTDALNQIPYADNNDDYTQNIQIAELNSLNASLAVIKWKKYFGFYHNLRDEYNSVYDISLNMLVNDEIRT